MSRSPSVSPRNDSEPETSRKAFSKIFNFENVDLEAHKIKKEFLATPASLKENIDELIAMLKGLRAFEQNYDKTISQNPGYTSVKIPLEVNGVKTEKVIGRSDINRIYSDLYEMIKSFNNVFTNTTKAITHRKKKTGRLPPITYFVDELYTNLTTLVESEKYTDMGVSPVISVDGAVEFVNVKEQVLQLLKSGSPVSPKVISSIFMKMIEIDQKMNNTSGTKNYSLPADVIALFNNYVSLAESNSQKKVAEKRVQDMEEYSSAIQSGNVGSPGFRSTVDVPKQREAFNRNKFKYVNLSTFVTTLQDKNRKVVDETISGSEEYKKSKNTYQQEYKRLLDETKKSHETSIVESTPQGSLDKAKREVKKYVLNPTTDEADKLVMKNHLYASKLDQYKDPYAALNALNVIKNLETQNNSIYQAVVAHANSTYYQNILTNSNNYKKFDYELVNPKKSVKKTKKVVKK